MKYFFKKLIVFFYLLLTLVTLEIFFSFLNDTEFLERSAGTYSLFPNTTVVDKTLERRTLVSTNSSGFRQSGSSEKVFPNLFLGGSHCFGLGVLENESFFTRLNKKNNYSFYNGCIINFSITSVFMNLESILNKFKPKKILLTLTDSDFGKLQSDNVLNRNTQTIVQETIMDLLYQSDTFKLFFKNYLSRKKFYKQGKEPNDPILNREELKLVQQNLSFENTNNDYSREKVILEEMFLNLKQRKIELEILYIPSKYYWKKKFISKKKQNIEELISNFCDEKKLRCFFPASKIKFDPEDFFYILDSELNKFGHEKISEIIKLQN
ncbi:MAG: hypothetical protein SFU98_00875 [Leptospiraceae bacterium]|nr:hypothetical protein [Leptospiraceae bacterium]